MATGGKEKIGYSLANVRTLRLEKATNKYPKYISIAVCQDKIVVLDWNTYKVQIHGLKDGKVQATSNSLEPVPRDMCLMDAMTICVLQDGGLIKIMSIDSTDMSRVFKMTRTLPLKEVFDRYDGVVRFKDSLVVTGVRRGTMCWCIVSLQHGHADRIRQICKGEGLCRVTTKDNIIYILCNAGYESPNNGVYGFDILNPSQCNYTYKYQDLQRPTSIVINEDGNIFVCDYGYPDYCIHQLTASCQLVAIFTQGIPQYLYALFWDNGCLYGTCYGSPDITVFSPVYQRSHKASEVLVSDERKQPVIEDTAIQIGHGNVEKGQSSVKTKMLPFVPVPGKSEDKRGPVFYVEAKIKMDMEDGKEKVRKVQPSVKPPSVRISEIPEHSENDKQGFTKELPMMYTSGKTREDLNTLNRGCIVMKYGSVTGITSGRLMWNGASVRVVDTIGKSWKEVDYTSNPTFFRQVVVKPCGGKTLAKPGDSGALVFHCNGGDIRDLEAIGLHIGGTTNKKSGFMLLCSPIKLVFEQLNLSNKMFKRFQHIVQADQTIYSMQSQEIDHIKISHKKLEEQMQQLKDEMKSNATALEQKLKEEMKSNATALEQKLNEMQANTTAAMATALEQNMQRLIGMLSRTEEHKPSSE